MKKSKTLSFNKLRVQSKIYEIKPTHKDYRNFKPNYNQRALSEGSVSRIFHSMVEDGSALKYLPILVDKNLRIHDGYHRYIACIRLGEPFYIMEVPTDFTARQKAWTAARALLTKYRRKRPAIMQAIRDQINDLNWEISQYEKLWQKGAVTSGYAQYHNAPPSTWLRSVYTTTEHERKGTGRLTFIPKAREKAEKKAPAKAPAKVAQPLILGDVVEEETETVIP